MALSAGVAYVDIVPRTDAAFGSKLSGAVSGPLGKVGLAAGAAIGTAAVAAVATAVNSVQAFAGFQEGMNEVRTLLPNISDDTFSAMSRDVRDFAKEFKVLPDDVVPALYQSISAGVPQGNVFDFLETAQKAAKGGVTDLTTAVDGISSVTNAYGSEVLSAAEASDLMFTAVRLGKTNFSELSSSLFNVVPTASALGVQFGDVTAALAAMTSQGTPTSVATTQLRQLLVELSKDGSKAADTFSDMAGKPFASFIAEGGSVADALGIMDQAAQDNGLALQDLFGSVEAGSAALTLTSSDAFTKDLAEMGASAGATDAAFNTMDQGLSATWQGIKATFAVALLDIGEKLGPFVEQASEWFAETLPGAIDVLTGVFEEVAPVVGGLIDIIRAIFDALMPIIRPVVGAVIAILGGAWDVIKGIIDVVLGVLTGDWAKAWEGVQSIFGGVWNAIVGILRGAVDLIVLAVSSFVGDFAARIKGGLDTVFGLFREAPGRIVGFLSGLPGRMIALGADLIGGLLSGFGDIAGRVFRSIKDGISNAVGKVKNFFGIGSPSRVFAAEIGAPLLEGVVLPFTGGGRAVASAITSAVTAGANAGATAARQGIVASNRPARPFTVAATADLGAGPETGGGGNWIFAEGAIQTFNPAPEPASTSIVRELRRAATTLAK